MATAPESRFEAQAFGRLSTVNENRRFEMEFLDGAGRKVVVSLPVAAAVKMACLICDVAENAPYLVGGAQAARERRSGR